MFAERVKTAIGVRRDARRGQRDDGAEPRAHALTRERFDEATAHIRLHRCRGR